jgi:hypothetical protein
VSLWYPTGLAIKVPASPTQHHRMRQGALSVPIKHKMQQVTWDWNPSSLRVSSILVLHFTSPARYSLHWPRIFLLIIQHLPINVIASQHTLSTS